MIRHPYTGITFLCVFVGVVLITAFLANRHFPAYVIAGESSAGTWLSGVLLVFSGATSLILGARSNDWRWLLIAVFFLILAADERFMFHEQLKEHLIFEDHTRSRWIYELPVLAGAGGGLAVTFMLWKLVSGHSRYVLLAGAGFGLLSVGMDVLEAGVLLEDIWKLFGELSLACALTNHATASPEK